MNNKGQTLVLFVLLLPLFLMFIAFLVDTSLVLNEKTRINNCINTNMETILKNNNKNSEEIIDLFKENNIKITSLNIEDDLIKIKVLYKYKSTFGNILKFDFYNINVEYIGNYKDLSVIKNERNKKNNK